jgi:tetratricopeptide (TPR) repeat protein
MNAPARTVSEEMLLPLGPRALAVLLRRLALPLVEWLGEGAYAPFTRWFARLCERAEPWHGLGHDPRQAPCLELDAVDRRGGPGETQMWGVLWSVSRAMEHARRGDTAAARAQFIWTMGMIRDLHPEDEWTEASITLRDQTAENVAQALTAVAGLDDPPLDLDSLALPRFLGDTPGPRPAAAESAHAARLFDDDERALVVAVKAGRVAMFFGAGLSILSGIPGAVELRRALLAKLPASPREAQWLEQRNLPFEAFMETILQVTGLGDLCGVFACGVPSPAHHLLAALAECGLLRTIATTNFDEHLESALRSRGIAHRVHYRSDDLAAPAARDGMPSLYKLHGTVSDPASMALTMERVAGSAPVLQRVPAVGAVFAEGTHEAVLVLGYSCSDLFDVTPQIVALGGKLKRVFVVDHTPGAQRAEDVAARAVHNPFRAARNGTRLVCDTGALLARLARELGIAEHPAPTPSPDWRSCVDRWGDRLAADEGTPVGHEILGLLAYRCADYRAAKAHYRAALAAAGPRANPAWRSATLLRLAGCHRALSEYQLAARRVQEASPSGRRPQRAASADAGADGARGNVLFNTGRLAESIPYYERNLATWRSDGNRRALGTALANLGNAYGATGRLDEARACFEEALAIAQELGDKMAEGARLGGLGQLYRLRGRLEDAENAHRRSIELAEAAGDPIGVATQVASLGAVHLGMGRLEEAIEEGRTAAAMFEALGDPQGEARTLGSLGVGLFEKGIVELGLQCLVRSLDVAAAIGEGTVLVNAVGNLTRFVDLSSSLGAPRGLVNEAEERLAEARAGNRPDDARLLAALTALLPYCRDPV